MSKPKVKSDKLNSSFSERRATPTWSTTRSWSRRRPTRSCTRTSTWGSSWPRRSATTQSTSSLERIAWSEDSSTRSWIRSTVKSVDKVREKKRLGQNETQYPEGSQESEHLRTRGNCSRGTRTRLYEKCQCQCQGKNQEAKLRGRHLVL